ERVDVGPLGPRDVRRQLLLVDLVGVEGTAAGLRRALRGGLRRGRRWRALREAAAHRVPGVVEVLLADRQADVAEGDEVALLHLVRLLVEADGLELEVLEDLEDVGHGGAPSLV